MVYTQQWDMSLTEISLMPGGTLVKASTMHLHWIILCPLTIHISPGSNPERRGGGSVDPHLILFLALLPPSLLLHHSTHIFPSLLPLHDYIYPDLCGAGELNLVPSSFLHTMVIYHTVCYVGLMLTVTPFLLPSTSPASLLSFLLASTRVVI